MDEIEGPFEPPSIDERGGVTWRVCVGGKAFDVLAFLDSAYGPDAPLFRLPEAAILMDAAHAVNAVFTHWQERRAKVDPVLSSASALATEATRHLIPSRYDPSVRLEATIIPEKAHTVVLAGPPEITELECVRFPLLIDGAPVVGTISLCRPPGWKERVPHMGCEGTEDLEIVNAGMGFMMDHARENRSEVDALLARSVELRIAAGLTDQDLEYPQSPPEHVETRATVRSVFRTTHGRIVFVVTLDEREHLVDADSYGFMTASGSNDADNAAANYIIDHPRELAVLGLNVECWRCSSE